MSTKNKVVRTWTTLKELKSAEACQERFEHLYRRLGGLNKYGPNRRIRVLKILELNGVLDADWAIISVPSLGMPNPRYLKRRHEIFHKYNLDIYPLGHTIAADVRNKSLEKLILELFTIPKMPRKAKGAQTARRTRKTK